MDSTALAPKRSACCRTPHEWRSSGAFPKYPDRIIVPLDMSITATADYGQGSSIQVRAGVDYDTTLTEPALRFVCMRATDHSYVFSNSKRLNGFC